MANETGKPAVFGITPEGEEVQRIRLEGGGLTAWVMTYGAAIQDLRLAGHAAPLVLGFDAFDAYPAHSPYFGATPGRYANRIADGRFSIDGADFGLELNEGGKGHLHGGSDGLGRQNWRITGYAADFVSLAAVDRDGRAGYPGNLEATATYRLLPGGVLSVTYRSTTDKPTLANLCQHSYFNLDGSDTILGHDLMLAADAYLPVDARLIPTGEIRPVEGTLFDFRSLSAIGRKGEDGQQVPFDHNFCLSRERTEKRSVGLARSLQSGIAMEVRTSEPGVQFYIGGMLDVPVPGLDGRRYGAFAGFCLETQIWPDSINQAGFPHAVLRPGEVLIQETDYVFMKD